MSKEINPCIICENFMTWVECDLDNCPVALYKKEMESLRREVERLRREMSYMSNPNEIGDRHEMGSC